MATTIQLLRSDIARQRPDPGVLANGVPMVNLNETEPGLFFSDRTGTLFKVGPVAVGDDIPNTNPEGESGNSKGETWLDTSGSSPVLKVYDGGAWVTCFDDPGGTVTSVGLSFSSIFNVSGTPVTSSGTLTATLQSQVKNTVFAGPDTVDGTPSFRALVAGDIPAMPASKITTGQFDSGRIPSLDASKITSGTFSQDRIPNLSAAKITSGALSYTVGGTGITAVPAQGEVLVGTGLGWAKNTLIPGANVGITNGIGAVTVAVSDTPSFTSIALKDPVGDTLTLAAPSVTVPYTLNLPATDGTNGAILTTNGAGQLTFETNLYGLGSIGGLANLTINAGGANGNIILAPTGSGSIEASMRRIIDLATPTGANDAATKAYVDSIAAGIQPKAQVLAATTGNISLNGEQTIDTVPLVTGDRVLVKSQTLPEENGIYEVAVGAWSRTADANTFGLLTGAVVFVAGGATNLADSYLCTSSAGGTIGVDPVTWVLYSSGQGTVTSVDLTVPSIFAVTGNPITTAGTLQVALNTQTANTVFAGPSGGGDANPTFRTLIAADIPLSLGGTTFSSVTVTGATDLQGNATIGSDSTDTVTVNGTVSIVNDMTIGSDSADSLTVNSLIGSSVLVDAASTYDLGDATNTWANVYADNVYAGDVHMSNEGGGNEVDGTWGRYTIQEGEEDLYLINRRSGKKYKFVLQEV
jgi:hypothetical protein